MPVITGDAIKYNCIKPYVPSVPSIPGNRANPDETPQNAASDQELHSLVTGNYIRNRIKMNKTPDNL